MSAPKALAYYVPEYRILELLYRFRVIHHPDHNDLWGKWMYVTHDYQLKYKRGLFTRGPV